MSQLEAVRCTQCGGEVCHDVGKPMPACVFCGAEALKPMAQPEVEPPGKLVPFTVDPADAQAAFQKFAKSSYWYPSDLRDATLDAKPLLLPAWAWTGRLETHWTGLKSASTQSGKRPVTGSQHRSFKQVLIPSSHSLTVKELGGLGPYDESLLKPWTPETSDWAYEVSTLTQEAAKGKGLKEMERRHGQELLRANKLLSIHTSCKATELKGQPVLVPVYICGYTYGDKIYRVLIHGTTGALTGDAPFSWQKVLGVALGVTVAVVAVFVVMTGLIMVCSIFGAVAVGL